VAVHQSVELVLPSRSLALLTIFGGLVPMHGRFSAALAFGRDCKHFEEFQVHEFFLSAPLEEAGPYFPVDLAATVPLLSKDVFVL
jgi:hypothetical protein